MNTSLPVFKYKEEICEAIKKYDVTIITAETGSGKSTQVPQYANEIGYDVIVTQPRRMATWSLAQRVAEEMNTCLGGIVGYRTGYERNDSQDTSILYCTDGLELVRALADVEDDKPKVLIIDEVHEWNRNIETLIGWAKKKIKEKWSTKVVIMSAILEKEDLSKYFEESVYVIDIPGRLYEVSFEQRSATDLIYSIYEMVVEGCDTLVFAPGKKEISDITNQLLESKINAEIIPLHGELNSTEQKRCFYNYSRPKVVVATNIAQTSVTIPDISVVIDTGKENRLEAHDGVDGLITRDISQADILQRKGRAGRTKEGRYILCSNTSFEERAKFSVPEIQRTLLDQTVLKLASQGIDAEYFEFFHQPDIEEIKRAKQTLIDLGAFEENNKVTTIGYKMVKMPVSVETARMIVEAEKYGVTKEVICIASIMEFGGLLMKDTYYRTFTNENSSDLLAELDVWNELQNMKNINFTKLGINEVAYKRIKEQIEKMYTVLAEIVEVSSSVEKREFIKRACLAGMVNHVYKNDGRGYINGDNISRYLNFKSCFYSRWEKPEFIVGRPKFFPYTTKDGYKKTMHVVTFATKVTLEDLQEVASQFIRKEFYEKYYADHLDAIVIMYRIYFKDMFIGYDRIIDNNHPNYEILKRETQANSYIYNSPKNKRQEEVTIDGKTFAVSHGYWGTSIEVDDYTLFHTEVKNVNLDDGTSVRLEYMGYGFRKSSISMSELRNAVENARIKKVWKSAKDNMPELGGSTIDKVLEHAGLYGKKEVTCGNGGYGEPIFGFVCLCVSNKSLKIELLEDEKKAKIKMAEAVEFLYNKTIREKYSEKKFKFKKGEKGLSKKEQKVKEQFDAEVRELVKGLDINNIEERLSYLHELYLVMIEDLKIA